MPDATDDSAFDELTLEIRRLFHVLAATVEALHPNSDGLTASHRAVLESLVRGGPQTVPAMARARPVSRQYIQVLVNRLTKLGLVEARANPAHRRSPLIHLTPAGRQQFAGMRRRERRAVARSRVPVSERRLRAAADTLRTLREFFTGA